MSRAVNLILLLGFISKFTAFVSTNMSMTHINETCVKLYCGFQSVLDVAVGYYRKGKSMASFGRTIAIGGNSTNCQITPLPYNIRCECITDRYVSCTVCDLTVDNDGEEWRCAIPNNGVGLYSNTVRIYVPAETIQSDDWKSINGYDVPTTEISKSVSWAPYGEHQSEMKPQYIALLTGLALTILIATFVIVIKRQKILDISKRSLQYRVVFT